MTFQIRKVDLPCSAEEFAARVSAHVDRLNEYARHLVGVEADKDNPDLKPEERRHRFPPPTEILAVEQAIRYGGDVGDGDAIHVADYEIVGPSLTERKQALLDDVRAREADLIAEVMPPAKQRHWIFREMDIQASQAELAKRFAGQGVGIPIGGEDHEFLQDLKARRETQSAITRWAAKLEHDIFDLTEETVDGFEIGAFHG